MNTLERAKYRAKRIDNGEWAYGSLVKIESGDVFIFSRYFIPVNSIPSEWMIPVDAKTVGQFTGHQDRKGVDIYYGQDLNICFTSSSGEFIHDGIYTAVQGSLGELKFEFKDLMWVSYSYNQYPTSNTLCAEYGRLSTAYDDDRRHLIVPDEYNRDITEDRRFPFNEEKVLSFNSRYFELLEVAK